MSALDLDKCIEVLYKGEILPESTIKQLCDKLKEILIYESNVQSIPAPVTVVGDVHGFVIHNNIFQILCKLLFLVLHIISLNLFINAKI